MTSYTSVFGNDAIPVADSSYGSASLIADTTFAWPEVESGDFMLYEMMDFESDGAYTVTLAPANQVSVGRTITVVNRSAFTLTFQDAGANTLVTILTGEVRCLYITDNSTSTGVWKVVSFGAGTTLADASALAGYGLKVVDSDLALNTETVAQTSSYTVLSTDRARVIAFTGSGAASCILPQASTLGNGFLVALANQGNGSITIDPFNGEMVDGALTKALAPGESAFVICDGANWLTVGYGRSTQFQFTQLVLDISVGTPFNLTSVQAQNKLLQFIGTATENIVVNVPAVVAVYYIQASYSGAYSLTIKTASGTGVAVSGTDRIIVYCDGVNVVLAQTSAAPATDLAGGVAGAVVFQSAPDVTAFTAAGTAGQLLESSGAGTPVWKGLGIIINGLVGKTTPVDADELAISDSEATNTGKKLTWANLKTTLKTYFDTLYTTTSAVATQISNAFTATIGTTVQAYDADTVKSDVAQTFTAPQRTQETTDNDGSFDCNINLDFECTPTAGFTLTFTNIPASPTVQRGSILLVNGANYVVAAHANTKVTSSLLTTISATGTYILAYETRNGLAYVTSAGAFA